MCILIEDLGPTVTQPQNSPYYWKVVILDTPMFPKRYYAGPAHFNGNDWNVYSNASCYYYESLGEAQDAALKMFGVHN